MTNKGSESLTAEMQSAFQRATDGPPPVKCIMADHAVPYGRVYRQWNTRGELIVWANRGEIADLAIRSAFSDLWNPVISPALLGIPVVNA